MYPRTVHPQLGMGRSLTNTKVQSKKVSNPLKATQKKILQSHLIFGVGLIFLQNQKIEIPIVLKMTITAESP